MYNPAIRTACFLKHTNYWESHLIGRVIKNRAIADLIRQFHSVSHQTKRHMKEAKRKVEEMIEL